MKRVFLLVLSAILLAGLSTHAQAQTSPEKPLVPVGTKAQLSLRTPISSKLSAVDDRVIAVLDESLANEDGRIVIPAGAEFIGRITHIQAARRLHRQASLAIVFEQVRLAHSSEKIRAVVFAIDDYSNDRRLTAKNETGQIKGGRSAGRTGANAAKGASVGSMLGIAGVLSGGGYSPFIIGLDTGLFLGAVLTKGTEIRLNQETILRVRFEPVPQPPISVKQSWEKEK